MSHERLCEKMSLFVDVVQCGVDEEVVTFLAKGCVIKRRTCSVGLGITGAAFPFEVGLFRVLKSINFVIMKLPKSLTIFIIECTIIHNCKMVFLFGTYAIENGW